MRHLKTATLLLVVLTISWYAMSHAQVSNPTPSDEKSSESQKLQIVPLVMVKPGETKELLLSTWCTLGITRGGGLGLAEMRDGKPQSGRVKSFSERGVTISVPDFEEGQKFAGSPQYSLLHERDIQPFKVTITASSTAEPRLLEMHLVDATCSGHCKTDFRVLVVAP